jgi:hypothetical protein
MVSGPLLPARDGALEGNLAGGRANVVRAAFPHTQCIHLDSKSADSPNQPLAFLDSHSEASGSLLTMASR